MAKLGKKYTVVATYNDDLSLVLNWLRLNKAITSSSSRKEVKAGYAVRVTSKKSKKELNSFVKDKFGVFAKVI
jgi:hypothetical protein